MNISEKLIKIAENEQRVYDTGKAEGIEQGKQAEYDAFWNAFQVNGTRTTYTSAFANSYWSGDAYNPKYPITPTSNNGAMQIFAWNTAIEDIKVPVTIYDDVSNLFTYNYKLKRIPKLIIAPKGLTKMSGAFDYCNELEELNVEGTINIGGINLQWSTKLSKASIESVINALSTTTSGLSVTFSKTAKATAFTDDEWATLIATKPNWTINLV